MKALEAPSKFGKLLLITVGFLLLFVIGILDYFTGNEISSSLFYLFPVALIAKVSNWKVGSISAIVGAIIWLIAELIAGTAYFYSAILYWNACVRLSIFLVMAYTIELGRSLEYEATKARTDFVTGALNSRYFHERLRIEIDHSSRYAHPFTLAYLDVDNFKSINDQFGHSIGDKVLRAIVENLNQTLRKTDVVARAGGDEFVILLPETNSQAARTVIAKAFRNLLEDLQEKGWTVTISAGVITFIQVSLTVDVVLEMADENMYRVKTNGKNNVVYVVYD